MGLGIAILVNGASDPELAAAATIEVCERMGEATTYRLEYPLDIISGDLPLLTDSRLDAGAMLSILVQVGNDLVCLVKGPVYGQRIHLLHGGEGSQLEVLGIDTSIAMGRENKAVLWSDVTDSDVVSKILDSYDYTLDVGTTATQHTEKKHTLVQRESDLQLVRRLARRNGNLFWVTCDENDIETAHFQRPVLDGDPDTEVNINLKVATVEALDISWDVERPTSVKAGQLDLNTKESIDGSVERSPLKSLGSQALADIVTDTRSLHLTVPADDAGDLQARSEGALIDAGFFVKANFQVNLSVLGSLVRAHSLVKLRGAGSRHSGNYFCAEVRHLIDAAEHRMEVKLVRNGWEG